MNTWTKADIARIVNLGATGFGSSVFRLQAPPPWDLVIPTAGPWPLPRSGSTLVFQIDDGPLQTVTFRAGDFADMRCAIALEVAVRINECLSGATARRTSDSVAVTSDNPVGSVQVVGGTAADVFGFWLRHEGIIKPPPDTRVQPDSDHAIDMSP